MVIYSIEELEELCAFMQPVSPSVRIAKLFRNEGESGATASDTDKTEDGKPVDPFEGIDLDNLPEEVRDRIVAAKTQFATLQTDVTTTKAQKDAFEARARQFQSESDRSRALLQKHGLDPSQQQQQQQQQSPAQQLENELFEQYKAISNVDEATARAWAKMNSITGQVLQKGILREVGTGIAPTLQNVGLLTVDRMLDAAANSEEYAEVLQDRRVATSVRGYLSALAQNGSRIDEETLGTTVKMVIGEMMMKGNFQQQQQQQQQPPTRTLFGGSRMSASNGFHSAPVPPNQGFNRAPVAANPETAQAIERVTESMRRGMKKAK